MRRVVITILAALTAVSCASTGHTVPVDVDERIRAVTGATPRLEPSPAPSLPPGVQVADGVSRADAVAIALWNNSAFQVSVSQLGFARADLVDAGMISNPVLSLLFPVGPKQLETALRWPVEVLWERPRRMAAAELSLAAVAQHLVQSGLDLTLAVRLAFTDLVLALDRQALATESVAMFRRIDALMQSRLAAGDVAELEARAARMDAARSAQDAARLVHDVRIARERLRFLMGLAPDDRALESIERPGGAERCGQDEELLAIAAAARPDVRAAELGVEAAAARLGWERSRVLALTAVFDSNSRGVNGFEAGPGLDVGIPLFNRNQGGRLRGESELQRATAAYAQLRQQVVLDVRDATSQFDHAHQSRTEWESQLVVPLRANLANAEASFASGENSYLFVLENNRRLLEARVREREIVAEEQRAQARIERAAGIACRSGAGTPQ